MHLGNLAAAPRGFAFPRRETVAAMIGRILLLIIVGLVVGALGRFFHPGDDPMPIWLTIIIGIAATLIAGLLIGGIVGFIVAVIVAVALVALVARFYPSGRTRTV